MRQTRRTKARARLIAEKRLHVWCSGCGAWFYRTHHLLEHRRTFRCGGLWKKFHPELRIEDTRTSAKKQELKEHETKHRGRVPGTVRPSRMPGGSGYRNRPLGQKTSISYRKYIAKTARR